MKGLCFYLFLFLLNKAFAAAITRRHLGIPSDPNPNPDPDPEFTFEFQIDATLTFPNLRLKMAYGVLQEWKKGISADPRNMVGNWEGQDVCSYNGVFCEKSPDDPNTMTVAGIDLNHGDIAGDLGPHLGMLSDLSLFHINSNRFSGTIPKSLSRFKILTELDLSNNGFTGPFPNIVLELPKLKYLDLRFNDLEGPLPPQLFDKDLDAIFLNNNKFSGSIPENFGNSKASVIVLSNNGFKGCVPKSIGRMTGLEELVLSNNEFSGCLPEEIGSLENLTVLDFSNNRLVGTLPKSFERLKRLEKLDVGRNELIGKVLDCVCGLPKLSNLSIADNYFDCMEPTCEKPVKAEVVIDVKENCMANKPNQKPADKCAPVVRRPPIDCKTACEKQNGDEGSIWRLPPLFPAPPIRLPVVESSPPPDRSPPAPVFSTPPPVPDPRPGQQPSPSPGATLEVQHHHIFGSFGVNFGNGFFHQIQFKHESQTKR